MTPLRKSAVYGRYTYTKVFYFEGNGGNKSVPAREGTVDEVSRGGNRDDHHQSRKVRLKNIYLRKV